MAGYSPSDNILQYPWACCKPAPESSPDQHPDDTLQKDRMDPRPLTTCEHSQHQGSRKCVAALYSSYSSSTPHHPTAALSLSCRSGGRRPLSTDPKTAINTLVVTFQHTNSASSSCLQPPRITMFSWTDLSIKYVGGAVVVFLITFMVVVGCWYIYLCTQGERRSRDKG